MVYHLLHRPVFVFPNPGASTLTGVSSPCNKSDSKTDFLNSSISGVSKAEHYLAQPVIVFLESSIPSGDT